VKLERWEHRGFDDLRLATERAQRKLFDCRRKAASAAGQAVTSLLGALARALGVRLVTALISGLSVDAVLTEDATPTADPADGDVECNASAAAAAAAAAAKPAGGDGAIVKRGASENGRMAVGKEGKGKGRAESAADGLAEADELVRGATATLVPWLQEVASRVLQGVRPSLSSASSPTDCVTYEATAHGGARGAAGLVM
jgi:hypothetical protein